MNKIKSISLRLVGGAVFAAFCLMIGGCIYDVPITAKATRPVDARLLGTWTSKDGKDKMKVVRLDDSHYIVSTGDDLYRVYHSDVDGAPFVSVQKLEGDKPQYAYWTWKLSDDGILSLRGVNDKVVPDETKTSADVRSLLKKNLKNPDLFTEESQFTKDK